MTVVDPYGTDLYDGTTRQRTQCKIIVNSHIQNQEGGRIDCSRDVVSCNTSKTTKGGGGANFVLVPRRNFINLIFPNDYVNIYFNTGDGRGWIRTFFGFVDRISRSTAVSDDGSSTTRFQVICSDFTKAFDKTQVYFNPYIGAREDINGEFVGTANLGGLALITKGVAMHGSPADIIFSLGHVLLGFGSQFAAPKGYTSWNKSIEANRKKRVEWATSRLAATVQKAVGEAGGIAKLEELIEKEVNLNTELEASDTQGPPPSEAEKRNIRIRQYKEALSKRGLNESQFGGLASAFIEAKLAEKYQGVKIINLIDLIDWRYVEWRAIDGYVMSQSISHQEGSLWSIMNAWSNPDVNELFCDLRPVPLEPSGGASGGRDDSDINKIYSRSDDELGENEGAVRFAPCVVMREYPFSTIWKMKAPAGVKIVGQELKGNFYFGAIFSQGPNVPGRKVVELPALHEHLAATPGSVARKHLDVITINSRDINHEDIGRSDHDLVNFIEVYSDTSGGTMQGARLLTRDVQPITSAISVARHGLRVRRYETRYGRFSSIKHPEAGEIDSAVTRRAVIRWALLLDHWYQHNIEYLSGTLSTRALPELRVGYRLDITDRKESYYVEGVNHSWNFPNAMTTSITVSRGQRNDPYPVYVRPHRKGFEGIRSENSRLGEVFHVKDPSATRRSIMMWGQRDLENDSEQQNLIDVIDGKREWCKKHIGFMPAETQSMRSEQADREERIAAAIKKNEIIYGNTEEAPGFNSSFEEGEMVLGTIPGDKGGGQVK